MSELVNNLLWRMPHEARRAAYKYLKSDYYSSLVHLREGKDDTGTFKPYLETESIFVHIPKTAGKSMVEALYGCDVGCHKNLRQYTIAFSKKEFDRFFKFAFVRHPADRFCSAFWYLKKGGLTLGDNRYATDNLIGFSDVEQFVDDILTPSFTNSYVHWVPQYQYLCIGNNTPRLDFIGRYENLQDDFRKIAKRLHISRTLPHINASSSVKSWKEQLSMKARQKIYEIYRKDYDIFGYEI